MLFVGSRCGQGMEHALAVGLEQVADAAHANVVNSWLALLEAVVQASYHDVPLGAVTHGLSAKIRALVLTWSNSNAPLQGR